MIVDNFSVVIFSTGEDQGQRHPEYGNICLSVGNMTAAILEAKLNGVLTPGVADSIHGFLEGIQEALEEFMTES